MNINWHSFWTGSLLGGCVVALMWMLVAFPPFESDDVTIRHREHLAGDQGICVEWENCSKLYHSDGRVYFKQGDVWYIFPIGDGHWEAE